MLKRILSHPLLYILLFALILRIAMICYGLPLWVYNDEPPFVLAGLKMLQLKTVLPLLHQSDFTPFLYYPPYISYLYLPFFLMVMSVWLVIFKGSLAEFQAYIASDPSVFFITGRLVTLGLSLISIYLIYKIVIHLTKDKIVALSSSFFSTTSIMFIVLSITGKQWLPILFFYILGMFILCHPDWSLKKRYWLAGIFTGIGLGVSTIVILLIPLIICWYIFYDKKTPLELLRDRDFYKIFFVIVILGILPIILHPHSLGFVPDTTLSDPKTILGFITSPFMFTMPFIKTEPILFILFVIGVVFGHKKYKNYFIILFIFIAIYSTVFYMYFRFEYRFLLPLILPLIIGSSFGIKELKNRLHPKIFYSVLIFFVFTASILAIRLSYLGYLNDSRVLAKNWLEKNVKSNEKVLVYANLMRLPNNTSGIAEQKYIDNGSLRTVDRYESGIRPELKNGKVFHALNLYTVRNDNFYNMIAKYAGDNKYRYLIIAKKDFLNNPEQFKKVYDLTKNAKLVANFGNDESGYSLGKTEIGPNLIPLFKIDGFGPSVEIYELNR